MAAMMNSLIQNVARSPINPYLSPYNLPVPQAVSSFISQPSPQAVRPRFMQQMSRLLPKRMRPSGSSGSSGSFGFSLLFKNPYVLFGLFVSLIGALIVLIYFGQSYAQSSPTAYWIGFTTPICGYMLLKSMILSKRAIFG